MKKLFNILLVLLLSMGIFTSNNIVKAEESFTTKYAVQIYGIQHDTLEDGSTAGLTFGPALGQDFMNTYISHTPSGTTTSGNPHRCIHDDEWETIARWNHQDPYVYEQCISNNCTRSVKLTLSDTLKNPDFVYGGSESGDGVGALYYELIQNNNYQHLEWNPLQSTDSTSYYGTNEGGWGASRIRAMMNSADSLTTTGTNYGTYVTDNFLPTMAATDYTGSDTLLSAFPQILQDNIGARKTLYDSVYNSKTTANLKTSYDKLWLLSPNEMTNDNATLLLNGSVSWYQHPLESNGGYQKFLQNNQYIKGYNYNGSSNTVDYYNDYFKAYGQNGNTATSGTSISRWLRSSCSGYVHYVATVDFSGYIGGDYTNAGGGVAPCFSLNRSYIPSYDPADPLYDPQADEGNYTTKRGINANNEWVKNGDTWTYTFDVFDDSIPYYIWEDRIPGYTSSVMKPNKDLMNQNGEKYYEIINRSTTLGSLNITKTTDAETEDRFEFTITLEGNGLEGTKVFSNVIFTDGVGKIKLGKDESKLIEGLPAGVTYTVEETPYSDYITTSTGETGTIVQGEIQEVSFHNEKVPVKNLTAESGFKVKKVVEGNNEVAETFDFIAQINAGEPNKLINLSNGESITTDASGLIIYEFSLANNEELIFSNLSTGASYQVTEKAGEYISSYSIQDLNEGSSINQSANENTTQNQALTTAVETLDTDEEIEITFTNRIIKKQNLKVAKQVNGNDEDKAKQYEITVELFGLDPMATLDSDAGRFVADEDGYAIKTILLRDGEEFMIPEVPVGTQYIITESPSNTYAAYEITDANGGSNFVKSADSNSDINLRLATQMETVNENEEATVKFINTSQVTLKLEKVVDGNMGNKEDEFEFDVKVWKDNPGNEDIFTDETVYDESWGTGGWRLSKDRQTYLNFISTRIDESGNLKNNIESLQLSLDNSDYIDYIGQTYSAAYYFDDSLRTALDWDYEFFCVSQYDDDAGENVRLNKKSSINLKTVYKEYTEYLDLSQYGGISNGDGSYRFTLKHGDNIEIAKAFPGYNYEITEVDYSGEGYRTYPNNSMIQGRTISGVLNENTDVKMRNIRGGAVPTEIRFYIPIGIPVIIGLGLIFVLKRRKNNKIVENI